LVTVRGALLYTVYVWLSAVVGLIIGFVLIDRFSRRKLGIFAGIVQGIFAIVIALFGKGDPLILLVSIVGFGLVNWAIAIPLMWLWGTELFPTELRASGQGITNGVNRLAIASSSFIVVGGLTLIGELPLMLIFALLLFAFSAVIAAFKQFDTKGKSLEEIT
jgi:MFS family permease